MRNGVLCAHASSKLEVMLYGSSTRQVIRAEYAKMLPSLVTICLLRRKVPISQRPKEEV